MTAPAGADGLPRRSLQRFVLDDERIVLATRHHWARLLEPAATAVAAFAVVGVAVGLLRHSVGDGADLLWWLWLAVLARTVVRLVSWRTEWFVATDRRMLLLTGLVTRRVAMMPLHKVTDMSYARSVAGRILGYGEFVLESAGQDQAMRRIAFVPRPDASYRTLCATIFGAGAPAVPGAGPGAGPAAIAGAGPGGATGAAGAAAAAAVAGAVPDLPPVFLPAAAPRRPDRADDAAPVVRVVPVTQEIPVGRRTEGPAGPGPDPH